MRIQVRLPKIEPEQFALPEQCPYDGCSGGTFKPHGRKGEAKMVRDTDHEEVTSRRYRCTACSRTFRVYPYHPFSRLFGERSAFSLPKRTHISSSISNTSNVLIKRLTIRALPIGLLERDTPVYSSAIEIILIDSPSSLNASRRSMIPWLRRRCSTSHVVSMR